MLIFSRVKSLTDQQIQEWLRRIDTNDCIDALSIALSGAHVEIKECILRNMSQHAKTVLNTHIREQERKNLPESVIRSKAELLVKLL